MALQQQQRLTSQIQQQQEQHERDVAALREKLQEQQKRGEQHSRSPEALIILEQLNDNALKQLASAMEMGAESQGEGKDSWQYRLFTKSSAEVMEKLANVPLAGRIADKLSAAGIIGEYVNQLAHIHAPGVTEVDRARPIIAALKDKIQHDVQIYHSFRGILLSFGADSDTALHYLPEKGKIWFLACIILAYYYSSSEQGGYLWRFCIRKVSIALRVIVESLQKLFSTHYSEYLTISAVYRIIMH